MNKIQKLEEFIMENKNELVELKWSDLINTYSENLGLTKILLKKLGEDKFFENAKETLKSLDKSIGNYISNAKNPSYQIAIVGAIKAGKSTLINALLDYELASVNVTPETATLTKFIYSEKNSIKLKFYSKDEWNEIWKEAKERQAEIFLEEFKNLNAESIKEEYVGKEEIYLEFESIEKMKKEIFKWTSSQEKEHYFVKEIQIGLKELALPQQICLVDTPGLNDIIDSRSKITRDYIDIANAIIVCVNAKTLRNEELLTISKVFSKARYKKDKIYVLGTQIDTMNSFEDWKKQRENWIKILSGKEFFESRKKAEEHLIGISSIAYSMANKIKNKVSEKQILELVSYRLITLDSVIGILKEVSEGSLDSDEVKDIKESIIKYSKIREIKQIINNGLLINFNKDMVIDYTGKYKLLKSEIQALKDDVYLKIKEKVEELNKSEAELKKAIEEKKDKIKKIEKLTSALDEKIKETKDDFNVDFSKLKQNFKKLEKDIKAIKIDD